MSKSKIEWTNRTWNPVTGCTKVSQGCKFCYAETLYERFNGKGSFRNITCHEERLMQPLSWKGNQMCFVNSMSDLFHEDVPFEFIDRVLAVTRLVGDKHTFQILTKRPERLLEYLAREKSEPLFHNVWIGVSVEDQKAANERIPLLLQVSAAVRFLSCEPLLGPLDLSCIDMTGKFSFINPLAGTGFNPYGGGFKMPNKIDWVIVGGESGPKARPMHPDWVRMIHAQCKLAGTSFFFKQWGEYYTSSFLMGTGEPHFRMFDSMQHWINKAKTWVRGGKCVSIDGRQCNIGKDFAECAYPVAIMDRVGKKKAGRLLDGVLHDEFPKSK